MNVVGRRGICRRPGARMGCWGSKDEEVTEQEITEAQGKAATKGGSALTVIPPLNWDEPPLD